MPPGISKSNVKKRKASDEFEEREDSEEQQSMMVAGRQRRSAAMKSHMVWDTLKPGAKPQLGMEEDQPQPDANQGASKKRQKRGPKLVATKEEQEEDNTQANTKHGKQEQQLKSTYNSQPRSAEIVPAKITSIVVGTQEENEQQLVNPENKLTQLPPPLLLHSKQSALKREQLELIERDMDQFDDTEMPSDEEEEDQPPARYVLDDPNEDDDYFAGAEPRRARGGARGRGSRGGGQTARGGTLRGRPRGSRAGGGGGGIMRDRIIRPVNYFSPQSRQLTKSGIYSLQPAGGIVGELSAARSSVIPGQASVRVLRPALPLSNFQSLRPSSINISAISQQQQMAETNFVVNQELEKYRGRIVAGTSVQEFNEIIDHLLAEYGRIADDRSRLIAGHREYVNHLKLAHQAAQDIKDNKIRHLEQTVEQLQQKLMANIKQEQLRVVKQGALSPQEANAMVDQQQQQRDDNQNNNNQSGRQQRGVQFGVGDGNNDQMERSAPMEAASSGPEGGASDGRIHQIWSHHQNQPNQRVRIIGMPQLGNPLDEANPYFNDEMDDEEEFGEDESGAAEMDDELGAQVTI